MKVVFAPLLLILQITFSQFTLLFMSVSAFYVCFSFHQQNIFYFVEVKTFISETFYHIRNLFKEPESQKCTIQFNYDVIRKTLNKNAQC